uniref:hypothetical protein n=1 Tax=Candidatus Electronema sp. TaxID=2698783 RepID=UPI004056590C
MSGIVITSSVTLPANNQDGKQYEAFKVWVSIPVCDDKGITIDNVKNGDEITIYNAAGIASGQTHDFYSPANILPRNTLSHPALSLLLFTLSSVFSCFRRLSA